MGKRGIDLNADEAARREVLINSPVIAVVGRSNDHYYTSYQVGEYLENVGYTIVNVNPNVDEIDGERVYNSLREVPGPVDIVDVFRKGEFLPQVVEDAIAVGAKTVWAQLDVENDDAREQALASGLNYAQNLCVRTEHERLFKDMVQG